MTLEQNTGGDKKRMLIFGMPGADSSHFKMNIAQPPQGPILKDVPDFVPDFLKPHAEAVRSRVNKATSTLFNPNTKAPYSGMHLIKENLERDTDGQLQIDLMEYPEVQELLELVRKTRYAIIGLSIGCENKAPEAAGLVQLIKQNSCNPDVEIVMGNFGAAAGKKLGILKDEENVSILWDSPDERAAKMANGQEYWTSEGIHDMRLFLQNRSDKLGIPINTEPDGPKLSRPVPDMHPVPKNPLLKKISEKAGLLDVGDPSYYLPLSVGCPRQCDFCNNYFMFGGKNVLINSTDELFAIMEESAEKVRTENGSPFLMMNFRDENFTKPMDNLIQLCGRIQNSPETIRFSTFGDLEGLYAYWKEHGSFTELSRGGLSNIWIGIESRTDFYNKRGGASSEEVEAMIKNLHSLGISVLGSFMVGIEGQTKEHIAQDMEWSTSLGLGPRQVAIHSMSGLASRDMSQPNECFVGHPDGEIAHIRNRHHDHFTSEEIEAVDKEWREKFYLETGPVSAGYLLNLWDGYKNLSGSDNPHDIKTATYCYWQIKNYIHQMSVVSLGFHGGIFKEHSGKFLKRFAAMFDEFESAIPPQTELNTIYEKRFARTQEKVSPIALGIGKVARKLFSWRNR